MSTPLSSDLLIPANPRCELPGCVFLEPGQHVAVGVEGGRDLGVAEPLLHDLGVNALQTSFFFALIVALSMRQTIGPADGMGIEASTHRLEDQSLRRQR